MFLSCCKWPCDDEALPGHPFIHSTLIPCPSVSIYSQVHLGTGEIWTSTCTEYANFFTNFLYVVCQHRCTQSNWQCVQNYLTQIFEGFQEPFIKFHHLNVVHIIEDDLIVWKCPKHLHEHPKWLNNSPKRPKSQNTKIKITSNRELLWSNPHNQPETLEIPDNLQHRTLVQNHCLKLHLSTS